MMLHRSGWCIKCYTEVTVLRKAPQHVKRTDVDCANTLTVPYKRIATMHSHSVHKTNGNDEIAMPAVTVPQVWLCEHQQCVYISSQVWLQKSWHKPWQRFTSTTDRLHNQQKAHFLKNRYSNTPSHPQPLTVSTCQHDQAVSRKTFLLRTPKLCYPGREIWHNLAMSLRNWLLVHGRCSLSIDQNTYKCYWTIWDLIMCLQGIRWLRKGTLEEEGHIMS
jgi:hypothetical protein